MSCKREQQGHSSSELKPWAELQENDPGASSADEPAGEDGPCDRTERHRPRANNKTRDRTRSKKCIPAFRRGNAGLFQGPFVSGQMWVRLAVRQEQSAAVPARVGGSWGQAVPRAPGRAEHSPHCQGCSSLGDGDISPAQTAGAAVGTRMGLSGDANRDEAVWCLHRF